MKNYWVVDLKEYRNNDIDLGERIGEEPAIKKNIISTVKWALELKKDGNMADVLLLENQGSMTEECYCLNFKTGEFINADYGKNRIPKRILKVIKELKPKIIARYKNKGV